MRVFVYWNLHKKLWSVKALEGPQKGRVVDHSHHVRLIGVVPKVSEAGRQRVLKEKRKNVHAGITGYTAPPDVHFGAFSNENRISYNPYKGPRFYFTECPSVPYTGSSVAVLTAVENKPEVYVA